MSLIDFLYGAATNVNEARKVSKNTDFTGLYL